MDIASLAGILLALFMLVFGIISSAGVGGFREYLDPASAIITFGGAFSCTLMRSEERRVGKECSG